MVIENNLQIEMDLIMNFIFIERSIEKNNHKHANLLVKYWIGFAIIFKICKIEQVTRLELQKEQNLE